MTAFVVYRRAPGGVLEPHAFVNHVVEPDEALAAVGLADAVCRPCREVPAADVLRAQYHMLVRAAAEPARRRALRR